MWQDKAANDSINKWLDLGSCLKASRFKFRHDAICSTFVNQVSCSHLVSELKLSFKKIHEWTLECNLACNPRENKSCELTGASHDSWYPLRNEFIFPWTSGNFKSQKWNLNFKLWQTTEWILRLESINHGSNQNLSLASPSTFSICKFLWENFLSPSVLR